MLEQLLTGEHMLERNSDMKVEHIKHCEKCGTKLKVKLENGSFNIRSGEEEFTGGFECPNRKTSLFGLVSNGHSYFRGVYRGMGEFFKPFIFNKNKKLVRIGD